MKKTVMPEVPITKFEVADGGALRMASYAEAETRADSYTSEADCWSVSPEDLAETMKGCQPLAWAVQSIYSDVRQELQASLRDAQRAGSKQKRRLVDLKALPEEPEEGAEAWLLSLNSKEFEDRVVPVIGKWFGEQPDWAFEDDYLPESGAAQGAALEFFRDMARDELRTPGVKVIDGEFPGSTYYAAKLGGGIDEANHAAEAAGIPVRLVAASV